jgi:hypothetical protein
MVPMNAAAVRRAFETAGVEFGEGDDGVRMRGRDGSDAA